VLFQSGFDKQYLCSQVITTIGARQVMMTWEGTSCPPARHYTVSMATTLSNASYTPQSIFLLWTDYTEHTNH